MNWRELFSTILTEQDDTLTISAQPNLELLATILAELVLNFVLMKGRTEKTSEVGMTSFALINIHSLVPNVSIITTVRDDQGNRLSRIGYSAMTAFEDVFSKKEEIQEFYTIGATVFGVRPIPERGERISLSFIPYVEVNSLDEVIPLSQDYRPALEALLFSFMLARLGHFDRAVLKLKEGLVGVTNVQRRLVRP